MIPTVNDYIELIYNRFEAFVQSSETSTKLGHPYVYGQKQMIVFFMWMQFKRIYEFKTQRRWLMQHPQAVGQLGWSQVPHRTTLLRRYKKLYDVLQEFIAFLGANHGGLAPEMKTEHLNEDKSLFKAQGTVWHERDREQGGVPAGLRNLYQDAGQKVAITVGSMAMGFISPVAKAGFQSCWKWKPRRFLRKTRLSAKSNEFCMS